MPVVRGGMARGCRCWLRTALRIFTSYGIASGLLALDAVGHVGLVPAGRGGTARGCRRSRRWVLVVLTLYDIASELLALGAVGPGRLVPARSNSTAPDWWWWRPVPAVFTLYGIASGLLGLDAVGAGRLRPVGLVAARSRGAGLWTEAAASARGSHVVRHYARLLRGRRRHPNMAGGVAIVRHLADSHVGMQREPRHVVGGDAGAADLRRLRERRRWRRGRGRGEACGGWKKVHVRRRSPG